MRVLLLGHSDGFGGAQTAFRRTVAVLEAWPECELATVDLGDRPWLPAKAKPLGHLAWHPAGLIGNATKIAGLYAIRRRAREWCPTIIISIGLNNSFSYLCRSLRGEGYRVGLDFIADRDPGDPILSGAIRAYDAIAVQAPSMRARATAILRGKLPVNWLPCFAAPVFPSAQRLAQQRRNEFTRYVYFGRLAKNKGLDLLIRAFRGCAFDGKPSLDIWGAGEIQPELRALILDLGLADRVRLMGAYPDGQSGAELLAAYDVLTLTSTNTEGLPLILLEAMAYGLALVATDVGALPDAGGGLASAQFVRPEVTGVTAALERADRMHRNGQTSPEVIMNHYDADFSEQQMMKRWQEMLRSPREFFQNG